MRSGEFIDDSGIPRVAPEAGEPSADNFLVARFFRHDVTSTIRRHYCKTADGALFRKPECSLKPAALTGHPILARSIRGRLTPDPGNGFPDTPTLPAPVRHLVGPTCFGRYASPRGVVSETTLSRIPAIRIGGRPWQNRRSRPLQHPM